MKPPKADRDTVGQRPRTRASSPQFSPIDALFVQQQQRPSTIASVDPELLGAIARVALTLDGTLTTLLTVLADEAIVARVEPAAAGEPAELVAVLDLAADEPTQIRVVHLCGTDSDHTYIAAHTVLVPGRFPAGFAQALEGATAGIGQALVETRAEVRRELLWWGEENGTLVRAYRIIHQGRPMAAIEERFLPDFEALTTAT